ncbi:MAG: response regulator transcription factor [Kiritimatiellae bacterium]|nr:response regulator transcription factor [Kiritimatiellia bacterium]
MRRQRILLIDDEQHIIDVVVYILEENGFEVLTALDGDAGLRRFHEGAPDLIVLDLNLPGIAGMALFHEMRRARPNVPIIMLTSRGEEIDRVLGLEMGADDYVTKPFSPRELAARVKSVLRRTLSVPRDEPQKHLSHGPIRMDCEAFAFVYFGRQVQLSRAEFKLMECLVRFPARVFTRDVLIDRIYDGEHFVTDRSVDAHIKRIRRKLAEIRAEPDAIETVHGLGYKLNSNLEAAT